MKISKINEETADNVREKSAVVFLGRNKKLIHIQRQKDAFQDNVLCKSSTK